MARSQLKVADRRARTRVCWSRTRARRCPEPVAYRPLCACHLPAVVPDVTVAVMGPFFTHLRRPSEWPIGPLAVTFHLPLKRFGVPPARPSSPTVSRYRKGYLMAAAGTLRSLAPPGPSLKGFAWPGPVA